MTNVIYPPEFGHSKLHVILRDALRAARKIEDPLPCDSEWRPDDPSQPARELKEVK